MTNKKIWAATLFSTLLLTMTISSPVKAAELQTSTTVDRSRLHYIDVKRQKKIYFH